MDGWAEQYRLCWRFLRIFFIDFRGFRGLWYRLASPAARSPRRRLRATARSLINGLGPPSSLACRRPLARAALGHQCRSPAVGRARPLLVHAVQLRFSTTSAPLHRSTDKCRKSPIRFFFVRHSVASLEHLHIEMPT